MWTGEGWQRTQRQLGVAGFIGCFILGAFGIDVPIGVTSMIGGLLGLDLLVEALDRVRGAPRGSAPAPEDAKKK